MKRPRRLDLWFAFLAPIAIPFGTGAFCLFMGAMGNMPPRYAAFDAVIGMVVLSVLLLPIAAVASRKLREHVDVRLAEFEAIRFPDLEAIAAFLDADAVRADAAGRWSGTVDGLPVTLTDVGKSLEVRIDAQIDAALRLRTTVGATAHWTGDADFDRRVAVDSRSEAVYVSLGREARRLVLELLRARGIADGGIEVADGVLRATLEPQPDRDAATFVRRCVELARQLRPEDRRRALADSAIGDPSTRVRFGALACLTLEAPDDEPTLATCRASLADGDPSIRALAALALPDKRQAFLELTPPVVLVSLVGRGLPIATRAIVEALGRCGAPGAAHLAALRDSPAVVSASLTGRAEELAAGAAGDLSLSPAQGGELSEAAQPGALAFASKTKPTTN